ncbi:unnamed protein product, partial [Mesorhabditis belari]|uniref:UBC core domain-containing protein n=1 Tax=Mesorhabditis belari TaxID=2138241 RepID=A0AAF3FJ07_9BILA
MSFEGQYNTKSAGVKRLMKEASELREPTELFAAQPIEDNLFEWHFTVRGPADSDFDGGIYHGRIIFPPEYPMKPPNMMILTPNGRFELNKKICLSISGYHPETWQPSWSIRTALLALVGFMPTDGAGAIGSLDYPAVERKRLAKKSLEWTCKECGKCMKDALRPLSEAAAQLQDEAKELAKQLKFQDETTLRAEISKAATETATSAETNAQTSAQSTSDAAETVEEVMTASVETETTTPASVRRLSISRASPSSTTPSRPSQQRESSIDRSLFLIVPAVIVCTAIFVILLARRLALSF